MGTDSGLLAGGCIIAIMQSEKASSALDYSTE